MQAPIETRTAMSVEEAAILLRGSALPGKGGRWNSCEWLRGPCGDCVYVSESWRRLTPFSVFLFLKSE